MRLRVPLRALNATQDLYGFKVSGSFKGSFKGTSGLGFLQVFYRGTGGLT